MEIVNESGFAEGWIAGKVTPPQWSATFIVKATYALRHGEQPVLAPEQLPITGDEHLDQDLERPLHYPSDGVYRKPRADLLLLATCHSPGGRPTSATTVTFQVGRWSKTLAVIGKRNWRPLRGPTAPEPFRTMPISYANAYGGPGYARNPLGKGAKERASAEGVASRSMPNVEWVDRLITNPDQAAEPAGFGPIPMMWPQRMAMAGSYGKNWLERRWPWYPEDLDWSCFNAAPEDQQLAGYLRGDEELRFENLHPVHARYSCSLPGVRARCFLNERVKASYSFREVPLNLDTLWIDLDAERMVLVWRGNVPVRTPVLDEVFHVFVTAEPLGRPQALPHYEQELDAAIARRKTEQRRLEEEEEPEGEAPDEAEEPEELEEPEEPGDPDEPDEPEEEDDAETPEEAGSPASASTTASIPPPVTSEDELDAERQEIVEMHDSLTEMGKPFPASLERMRANLTEDEDEPPDAAETDEPADSDAGPLPEDEVLTVEQLTERIRRKQSLAGQDLSGWRIAGVDLSSMDLREVILQDADLRQVNLSGADLSGAVLAGANLSSADLRRTILTDADLAGAVLERADVCEAVLEGADLSEARLRGARLRSINAPRSLWCGADLSDSDLRGARLESADLSEARLHRTQLAGSDLTAATLERAWGHRLVADDADLTKAKAAHASFCECTFGRIRGHGSIWENGQYFRCDFTGARLDEAEFSDAYLAWTTFDRASLKDAVLDDARLIHASMLRVNLFAASAERTDFTAADLRESNLYDAVLWDATTKDARLDRANLKMAKIGRKA